VALVQAGNVAYMGVASGVIDHFAHLGYPCPAFENPADHIMDVITPNQEDTTANVKAKVGHCLSCPHELAIIKSWMNLSGGAFQQELCGARV